MLTRRRREPNAIARRKLDGVELLDMLGEQRFGAGIADDCVIEDRYPTRFGNVGK